MNFTRLLATSRSLIGLKKKPGPYKMSQDHLLPNFSSNPKAAVDGSESRPGGDDARPVVDGKAAAAAPVSDGAANGSVARPAKPSRSGGKLLMSFLGGWNRVTRRGRGRKPTTGRIHVQTELSLDRVRVVRNDLKDSDARTAATGEGRTDADGGAQGTSGRQPLGMVWNRLSARLLRQAAQEFNVVQKERGKLLTQAGNGGAGAGGA